MIMTTLVQLHAENLQRQDKVRLALSEREPNGWICRICNSVQCRLTEKPLSRMKRGGEGRSLHFETTREARSQLLVRRLCFTAEALLRGR